MVRVLYEDTVTSVAEVARLAGVSERTLYKYVVRGQAGGAAQTAARLARVFLISVIIARTRERSGTGCCL